MRKLKHREIKGNRDRILAEQGNRCGLCQIPLAEDDAVLDHCHTSGRLRGVLCRNCNGIEGKVHNLARRAKRKFTPEWWLARLIEYWDHHDENPSDLMHPTHKTAEDKRLLRNKKAREKRAAEKT